MNDPNVIEGLIDAQCADDGLRFMFGEWLRERGDAAAETYLWLGRRAKRPFDWATHAEIPGYRSFDWYSGSGAIWNVPGYCTLPLEMWLQLPPSYIDTECWSAYPTRRDAERALCAITQE